MYGPFFKCPHWKPVVEWYSKNPPLDIILISAHMTTYSHVTVDTFSIYSPKPFSYFKPIWSTFLLTFQEHTQMKWQHMQAHPFHHVYKNRRWKNYELQGPSKETPPPTRKWYNPKILFFPLKIERWEESLKSWAFNEGSFFCLCNSYWNMGGFV